MDPLEEMEQIVADPDYCPTCFTKFLVDDTGKRMCAARCTEHEGNTMDLDTIDGVTYEPAELVAGAPIEDVLNELARLRAAFFDLRQKYGPLHELLTVAQGTGAALEGRLERLNADIVALRERHQAEVAHYRRDLEIIGSALYDEATNRDWCSEYDNFADEVNGRTHGDWLKIRTKEFSVRYIVNVKFTARQGLYDDITSELYSALSDVWSRVDTDVEECDVDVDS